MKNVSRRIAILTILVNTGCNAPSEIASSSIDNTSSSQSSASTSTSTAQTQSTAKTYTNFAYATADGKIGQYSLDPDTGEMAWLQPNSLNIGSSGTTLSACAMKFDPSYKFIFVSNCSGSTVSVFARNATTGVLSYVTGDAISNAISTQIANTRNRRIAVDASYVYIEVFKNTNTGTLADYLYRFNFGPSGALSNGVTLASNTPSNDIVGNYETSHGLDMSQTYSASWLNHTYKVNFSTGMIDQYDDGTLSAFSFYAPGGNAYVILTH